MEHFEEWIEWILLNPEMAFKKEPELLEKINKELSLCKPFYKALLIQKIPDHFPKWRNDVDLQFGSKKKELLKDYIKIISIALKEENYSTEEEISAFKKVKNQLAEQLFYWKSMLGDRYKIDVFDNEDFKQNHLYQTIQREFKKVGYYSFVLDSDNVKIYTPELAYLFVNNDLEYFNLDSKVKEVVNRWEFLSMYIEGFKKGVNMFDMEYKIPTSVLYSSNSEQYI
ncbi:MAG: hypothetical protein ACK48V_03500, partial [Crocinitomicaceae bacterium]